MLSSVSVALCCYVLKMFQKWPQEWPNWPKMAKKKFPWRCKSSQNGQFLTFCLCHFFSPVALNGTFGGVQKAYFGAIFDYFLKKNSAPEFTLLWDNRYLCRKRKRDWMCVVWPKQKSCRPTKATKPTNLVVLVADQGVNILSYRAGWD